MQRAAALPTRHVPCKEAIGSCTEEQRFVHCEGLQREDRTDVRRRAGGHEGLERVERPASHLAIFVAKENVTGTNHQCRHFRGMPQESGSTAARCREEHAVERGHGRWAV